MVINMLNKTELLKEVEEKYIPMLKAVNIPDFYKCIAQFSGLHINKVDDKVMKEYLLTWTKNKYRFFVKLGNKLRVDTKIEYKDENTDTSLKIRDLEKNYASYALWLEEFRHTESNKIHEREVSWNIRETISRLFPECRLEGCSLTHFFKSFLNAPDNLVNDIGRVWENQIVEGIYTVSIDPVDMMLASENPYGWVSCYRLALDNDGSHADGCLAAILDDSSLITYIWSSEGKFSLYDEYQFKSIRYFKMRKWISVSPDENAIHFNLTYPGKSSYSKDFEKSLRAIVEDIFNKDAIWKKNEATGLRCKRLYPYGYSEFSYDSIYRIKDAETKDWLVYNEQILCPCGCGDYLVGSHDAEDDRGVVYVYNGEGFIAENFDLEENEEDWCEYIQDYCCHQDCRNCEIWNRCNAVCELDVNESCPNSEEAMDEDSFDPVEDNVVHCGGHCENCEFYKRKMQEMEEEAETLDITTSLASVNTDQTLTIDNAYCDLLNTSTYTINANISTPLAAITPCEPYTVNEDALSRYINGEWLTYPTPEPNPPTTI